jgi:hypothetical protein
MGMLSWLRLLATGVMVSRGDTDAHGFSLFEGHFFAFGTAGILGVAARRTVSTGVC